MKYQEMKSQNKFYEHKIFFERSSGSHFVGRIRVNTETVELFYHLAGGSNIKAEMEGMGSGEIKNGYLTDHFSFHADGTIHSKARNEKREKLYLDRTSAGFNVFNQQRAHYLPFFLESICLSDDEFVSPRFHKSSHSGGGRDLVYDVTGLNSVSIFLISKCEKVDPEFIAKELVKNGIKIITADIIGGVFKSADKKAHFSDATDFDTDLMVVLVENILMPFGEIIHEVTGEVGRGCSIAVCLPPPEMIRNMVNLN